MNWLLGSGAELNSEGINHGGNWEFRQCCLCLNFNFIQLCEGLNVLKYLLMSFKSKLHQNWCETVDLDE